MVWNSLTTTDLLYEKDCDTLKIKLGLIAQLFFWNFCDFIQNYGVETRISPSPSTISKGVQIAGIRILSPIFRFILKFPA